MIGGHKKPGKVVRFATTFIVSTVLASTMIVVGLDITGGIARECWRPHRLRVANPLTDDFCDFGDVPENRHIPEGYEIRRH